MIIIMTMKKYKEEMLKSYQKGFDIGFEEGQISYATKGCVVKLESLCAKKGIRKRGE